MRFLPLPPRYLPFLPLSSLIFLLFPFLSCILLFARICLLIYLSLRSYFLIYLIFIFYFSFCCTVSLSLHPFYSFLISLFSLYSFSSVFLPYFRSLAYAPYKLFRLVEHLTGVMPVSFSLRSLSFPTFYTSLQRVQCP